MAETTEEKNVRKSTRDHLTNRDLQVAKLVSRGNEREAIAATLGTNRTMVDRHMTKVIQLTGSRNSTEAVVTLVVLGLIPFPAGRGGTPLNRRKLAQRLFPGATTPVATGGEVAEYLTGLLVPDPIDEAERHVNDVLWTGIQYWSSSPRIPQQPGPQAPPPVPQQPGRDDR